ncbi:MAG: TadE/TadG family type IV pilus assembly protein [Acidobacteriota bacterium]
MRRRRRSGSSLLETALWVPFLVMLFVGTVEMARVSYTYYAVQKALYAVGRMVGTSVSADLCTDDDAIVTEAKNFAVRGGLEESSTPPVQGLQADQIQLSLERISPDDGSLIECDCSSSGCDTANGGVAPDYVVVSLTDGFPIQIRIPFLNVDPIPLRPRVRVPYGGL